jgi:O-antigen/teichoic acid export membrane protein
MNVVLQSVVFSALERYGSFAFFMLSTAVLSRLLSPEEFGISAVVGALTTIAIASFQELGASYLIQKHTLSKQDTRTAFTITFSLSALFAAGLFQLRDVAAWFFSEEGLKVGMAVSAVNFFLSPFSTTISALLRRNMAFRPLARCNLAGNFLTAVISVVLAALGYSFMAPIWGSVLGSVATTAFLLASRPDLSIFRPSLRGYREVVDFGAYSSGVLIMNVFYNLAPQLILGRVLDFTAVGLYGRAMSVTQVFDRLVIRVLDPVIMPAICVRTRGGADLRRIYLNAIELITVVQWPFMIFLAIMAEPIIWIWLSSEWIGIVPLVRVLCVASLFLFGACLTYPVLIAVGHVRDAVTSSLISLPPSLVVIFIASFFGAQAVAASALLTLPFQAIVAFYFVSRHLAIVPGDLLRAMRTSAIVTSCSITGVLVSMAISQFGFSGQAAGLLLAAACAAAGWWVGLVTTKHPLLAQIRLAASGVGFPVSRLSVFAGKTIGPNEKAP